MKLKTSKAIAAVILLIYSQALAAGDGNLRIRLFSENLTIARNDSLIALPETVPRDAIMEIVCGTDTLRNPSFRLSTGRDTIFINPLPCRHLTLNCYLPTDIRESYAIRDSFPHPETPPSINRRDSTRSKAGGSRSGLRAASEGYELAGFKIRGSKSVSVSGGGTVGGGALIDQNLMIEVEGKLSRDTRLSFKINDQDLPLSPDGRSAELRELDEIRVELTSPHGYVTLGDFDYSIDNYRFTNLERKLDGARGEVAQENFTIGAGAAFSGGVFNSVRIEGIDGLQGPYRLSGRGGESVIILAGTETVYLDGRKLQRGARADYTINYLEGTLNFTERNLIGSESRIEVDYEYGSTSFKKALYTVSGSAKLGEIGNLKGFYLRESDITDSPLGEDFTAEELDYLGELSDSSGTPVIRGIRYLGPGKGHYLRRENTSGDQYFEYVGPGLGDYMVTFREVGRLLGSYEYDPVSGGFKYVGEGLGDYDPAGEFVPPQRSERASLALELTPLDHLTISGEGAMYSRNTNLFAESTADWSGAWSVNAQLERLPLSKSLPTELDFSASIEDIGAGFGFQGRRYEADFRRQWNLEPESNQDGITGYGERKSEVGGALHLPASLKLSSGWGNLERTNGENSNRMNYSAEFRPSTNFSALFQRLDIDSDRLNADTIAASSRLRDNFSLDANWNNIRPRLKIEREEFISPGLFYDHDGEKYLEFSPSIVVSLAKNIEAGITFQKRDTDNLSQLSGTWDAAKKFSVWQGDLSYRGKGNFRLSGRLGHRNNSTGAGTPVKSSSTAGRVEVFSGNFQGRVQSHLLYEISHGSSLSYLVRYLPERYEDEGEYLDDGTYVGKAQGTHRRELVPAEVDPSLRAAILNLTSRENIDLTSWIDSSGSVVKRVTVGSTVQLERENTMEDSYKLYLLFPSALDDKENAVLRATQINTDLNIEWADPDIFTRLELIWNSRFDRRIESRSEEYNDRTLRLQNRVPLGKAVQWNPTISIGRNQRRNLNSRELEAKSVALANGLIVNVGESWRTTSDIDILKLTTQPDGATYTRLSLAAGLIRFLGKNGRAEIRGKMFRVSGDGPENQLLIDLLGRSGVGTSYETTAAVSVKAMENLQIHVRYTGRTNYSGNGFDNYGRAEIKYLF